MDWTIGLSTLSLESLDDVFIDSVDVLALYLLHTLLNCVTWSAWLLGVLVSDTYGGIPTSLISGSDDDEVPIVSTSLHFGTKLIRL